MPEIPAPEPQRLSAGGQGGQAAQPAGRASQDDQPAPGSPVHAQPPADPRTLSDAEVLEVEAVQRRQLLHALLHGTSRPASVRSGTGRGLLIGIAVAVAIALGVGLVAMVQATLAHSSSGKRAAAVVSVHVTT